MAKMTPICGSGSRISLRAPVLALVVMAFLAVRCLAYRTEKSIDFGDDVAVAARTAKAKKLVTVVYLRTPRCNWCRKMQVVSFVDRSVTAMADRFVWVKIDINEKPEVAARFGVRGVPHLVLLNVEGKVVASRSGYLPPPLLAALLRKSVDKAESGPGIATKNLIGNLEKGLAAGPDSDGARRALKTVVERLAQRDRSGRRKLMEAIRRLAPGTWPGLCVLLDDKAVAVRAAAGQALANATGQSLPFDPFAKAEKRKRQIAAWLAWTRKNAARAATRPVGPDAPTTQPARSAGATSRPARQGPK